MSSKKSTSSGSQNGVPGAKKLGARHKARKRAVDFLFEAEARNVDPVNLTSERIELARGDDTIAPVSEYTSTLVEGWQRTWTDWTA